MEKLALKTKNKSMQGKINYNVIYIKFVFTCSDDKHGLCSELLAAKSINQWSISYSAYVVLIIVQIVGPMHFINVPLL